MEPAHDDDTDFRAAAPTRRERVAVVGSGVSGLTAAYLLQRGYDVLLFEADDRLGGHAHTHDVADRRAGALAVDSGFIVHNARTYPNLLRLFGELGVATQETEMSMSVRCLGCGLEYAGAKGARGVFARSANLRDLRFLRMLGEIRRFHRHARRLLAEPSRFQGADLRAAVDAADGGTLGQFLEQGGYSGYFADHFLVPLVSAVWSTGPELVLRYPARYLFEFLDHHGMLSVTGSPRWRTVVGGSRSYVERAVKGLSAVNVSTPVRAVQRGAERATLWDEAGSRYEVDRVVLATHPDQALRLLTDATQDERDVLGTIEYSHNETVLHTDASLLPRSKSARSCWNYLVPHCGTQLGPTTERAVVTYDMNRLQHFEADDEYLVTLNATEAIDEARVLARMHYEHPVYTPESVDAQARLPELSTTRTAYAGAYHGWGFHEDGCASGVAAAATFGVRW
ncbi:FAD-dependent oxidoreductase [Actinospica durhamensis]|uniref:FAD-dependent oxidoreductase n=1 Tax=Actinospica durhamensis TaxID=1508375 RepID=A0A941INN4_9ACTN|nr:FAD-dependent oxidoreductase [Actinospica durhamensis]MBR7835605.1 FAD-dependent oxidoreductase [Actinospica durhamensis]